MRIIPATGSIRDQHAVGVRTEKALLRSSPDPAGLGAQSDLMGAPELISIEAVLGAPDGGTAQAPTGSSMPGSPLSVTGSPEKPGNCLR
jgi:hypothetical protein